MQPAGPETQPTSAAQAMLALLAVGACVLAVWLIRAVARPAAVSLRRTPGRPNRLNPLHVVGVLLAMWLTSMAVGTGLGLAEPTPATAPATGPAAATAPATGPSPQAVRARYGVAAAAVAAAVWAAAGLAVAARTFRHGLARGLGLSGRRWLTDSLRGLIGYLAILPVCVGGHELMVRLFEQLGWETGYHPVLLHLADFPPAWKALALFSVVVLAPLSEEVFFRGLVQSMVRQYTDSPLAAIAVAAALFGAVHGNQPQAIPSLIALAVALGYTYERTGRLWAPIAIHALFNAVNVTVFTAS